MSRTRPPALERLYGHMARMRAFELALGDLWARGLISGELHLGIGEEGIAAGVIDHLTDGDALALDHRSTPPLVGGGVDLEDMVLCVAQSVSGCLRGLGVIWQGHRPKMHPVRCFKD